jgi:hypothetical protein
MMIVLNIGSAAPTETSITVYLKVPKTVKIKVEVMASATNAKYIPLPLTQNFALASQLILLSLQPYADLSATTTKPPSADGHGAKVSTLVKVIK